MKSKEATPIVFKVPKKSKDLMKAKDSQGIFWWQISPPAILFADVTLKVISKEST